jgi:PAS domain S-box-containing protein
VKQVTPLIKILCVDDQPSNLLALQAALQGYEYEIIEALSGEEALSKVAADDFAVILLDVQMPVLDGFQTAARIRELERSQHTPIIFLTANYPSETYAVKGYEAGAVDYLFKPLNVEILRAKIAVFVNLFKAKEDIREKARLLREFESREREREIAELRRISERKYQDLVEGIHDGIVWVFDPTTQRFTYVSRRAEQITGYPMQRWISEDGFWLNRLHPDERSLVQEIFDQAIGNDGRLALEHRFLKPTGGVVWFRTEVHRQQYSESGSFELHGMSVDVTHLKTTEEALRNALKIRDEFLSIASHELKTPITPLQLQMQGFIRMIEKGRFQSVPEETLRSMLQISDSQVSRLSRLIDQLLDVSRLREGRLAINAEEVSLSELVRDVLRQVKHELEVADCQVSTHLDHSVIGTWDRLRIEQVVINLLVNAARYAAGKLIEITVTRESDKAVLRVQDHGMGIDKKDQARIFERFERAVPVQNYGGLGLGLYISRQIVELHGGSIRVESELGQGATFKVELPQLDQILGT